jgi:DNA repair exonuclease SbcCD ATPase subunit
MEKELGKLMSEKDKFKTVSDTVPEKEKMVDDIRTRLMGLEKVVVEVEKGKQEMQRKYEIEAEKTLNMAKLISEKEKVVKEMADKVSVLEHSLTNQESLRKHMEKNLQSVTEKYKKVVDSPDSDLQNRTREVSRLKEEISEIKTNYTIALNGLNAELKNRKDEIASLQVKVKDVSEKEAKIKELTDRITALSQQYRSSLDIMASESKKDKEDINRLNMKQSIYEQQSNELKRVKEALESLKSTYDKINSKLADEKRVEVENANQKVSAMKEEVKEMKEIVEKVKQDCIVKIVEARKMPKEGMEKIEKYEIENKRLENLLDASEKKIASLQSEMVQIIANTNAKNVFLKHKEDEIRRMEEEVRNAPPKLLDPSLRRDRDDALATLRQAQIELNITKEEVMQLSEKVQISEKSIQELEVDKQTLCKVQDDLNRTLNTMQRRHERDMGARDQRIRELEAVIAGNQK